MLWEVYKVYCCRGQLLGNTCFGFEGRVDTTKTQLLVLFRDYFSQNNISNNGGATSKLAVQAFKIFEGFLLYRSIFLPRGEGGVFLCVLRKLVFLFPAETDSRFFCGVRLRYLEGIRAPAREGLHALILMTFIFVLLRRTEAP